MNNKGQIYIFAAVIISVILFGLTITYNKIEQKRLSADFNSLSDNYNLESARFLNALIENPSPPKLLEDRFLRFSAEFSSYARSKDPNYELFYVFAKDNNLYLGNFLDKSVFIKENSDNNFLDGCYKKIKANIQLGGLIVDGTVDMGLLDPCGGTLPMTPETETINLCIEQDDSYNVCYNFDVIEGTPQVMIVTGEIELEQRQVYIGGKGFIKGSKELRN